MYQLTVRSPDGSEQLYVLADDQGLIVGRDNDSDIVLPSSRVSRRHARFFVTRGVLHIEDIGSQGGVFVGGARVSGTAELRPGPQIEIGEFKIRVKRDEAPVSAEYLGTLIGAGAMQGRTLTLPASKAIIGREEPADILVPDDSVSRRHAEIRRLADGTYVIRDLHSSNGTFINGNRLPADSDRPLLPADKVAFGDTQWQVASNAVADGASQRSNSRALVVLTLASLAIVAAIGVVYLNINPPERGEVVEDEYGPPAKETCQIAVQDKRFRQAVDACQTAYNQNPIDTQLRMTLRLAQREAKASDIFEDAKKRSSVDERDALEKFIKVPRTSVYFPNAYIEVEKLVERLSKKDLSTCREAIRRRDSKAISVSCGYYLDYTCHGGADQEILKAVRGADKAWACPARFEGWTGGGGKKADVDPFPQKYTDKDLAEAVRAYSEGKLDEAPRSLSKSKADKETVNSLREEMNAISARFKTASTLVAAGKTREAEEQFAPMFDRDARLMPVGVESYFGKTMRDGLAAGYQKMSEGPLDKEQYLAAYTYCVAGSNYRPNDTRLLACLSATNQKVVELVHSATDCENSTLKRVLEIAPKDAPPYTAAVETSKQLGCQ